VNEPEVIQPIARGMAREREREREREERGERGRMKWAIDRSMVIASRAGPIRDVPK